MLIFDLQNQNTTSENIIPMFKNLMQNNFNYFRVDKASQILKMRTLNVTLYPKKLKTLSILKITFP